MRMNVLPVMFGIQHASEDKPHDTTKQQQGNHYQDHVSCLAGILESKMFSITSIVAV